MKFGTFSPEENAMICVLRNEHNASAEEIAHRLGRSLEPTRKRIVALAKQGRCKARRERETIWTEKKVADLTGLWKLGESASKIARKLDVTKNAVVGKARRMGLPGRASPILMAPLKPAPATREERAMSAAIPVPRVLELVIPKPKVPREKPAKTCQWISGTPTADDSCKCGAPVVAHKPFVYCAEHLARAYVKPAKAEEEAA